MVVVIQLLEEKDKNDGKNKELKALKEEEEKGNEERKQEEEEEKV